MALSFEDATFPLLDEQFHVRIRGHNRKLVHSPGSQVRI